MNTYVHIYSFYCLIFSVSRPILARADLIDFQSFQHTDIKSTFARIRDNPTDNPKIPYDFISSQYRRIIINYTKTYKLPANSGTASTTSKKQV